MTWETGDTGDTDKEEEYNEDRVVDAVGPYHGGRNISVDGRETHTGRYGGEPILASTAAITKTIKQIEMMGTGYTLTQRY